MWTKVDDGWRPYRLTVDPEARRDQQGGVLCRGYTPPGAPAPKPPRVPRSDDEGMVWGLAGLAAFTVVTGTLMILGISSAVAWLLSLMRWVLGG